MNENQSENKLVIHAQYVKDLSFENPFAPSNLSLSEKPHVDLTCDVQVHRLDDQGHFDVTLLLRAKATIQDQIVFVIELAYGGVFNVSSTVPSNMDQILFVQCPHLLFPFARAVVANVVRDAGMMPLMIAPIDFMALYLQNKDAIEKQRKEGASPEGPMASKDDSEHKERGKKRKAKHTG